MTREQLEHILRAASAIARDPDVLVIGSQPVLGSFAEDDLPFEATSSIEADVAFFDDPADAKPIRLPERSENFPLSMRHSGLDDRRRVGGAMLPGIPGSAC